MTDRPRLTDAQRHALTWLADHGGHARIDRYGRAIATDGDRSRHQADTWLRLFVSGHVVRSMLPDHFGLSIDGVNARDKG